MGTTAEEIMTENVTTVNERTTLAAALEIMQEKRIRHLPVVRDQRLVGMLSDRDLRALGLRLVVDMETLERLDAKLSGTVASVMSTNLVTITRITELVEIIDLLLEEQIGAVPVVHASELVGIVSYIDILRVMRDQVG